MKEFLRLLSFAKPYGRYWPQYALFSIIAAVAGTLNFILIAPALEVIFDGASAEVVPPPVWEDGAIEYFKGLYQYYLAEITSTHGPMGAIYFVIGIILTASLLANGFRYLSQRVLTSLRTNVVRNIRREIYSKICRMHVGYFHDKKKGDILSSVSSDVGEVQGSVINSFQVIFREPLMVTINMIALFVMSYQLTLFTIIVLPIALYFISKLIKKLRGQARRSQEIMGQIIALFEETISGIKIIKAFGIEKQMTKKFDTTNDAHREYNRKIMNRIELATPLSEFLGVVIVCCVIFYAAMMMLYGDMEMTWTVFVAYLAVYYNVLAPIKSLANAYGNIQRGMASGQRIFAILDQQDDIVESPNPTTIDRVGEGIKFNNVSFRYTEELPEVLHNINLTIPSGKMYALVGSSGAGKSTMADLLPRFYDVTDGSISIAGIDIKEASKQSLSNLIGIVTQEAILFNDTVYNNICCGIENVTEEDVREAARIANAAEFIEQLPDGYQTSIGDRGMRLSGGQRQRLAIARAILKNPPILILDEATSALDTESERLVQEALLKLMQNRTSLVIAHRLSTIKHADCICVLEDGKIVEQGTHDELLKITNGKYYHLHSLQIK